MCRFSLKNLEIHNVLPTGGMFVPAALLNLHFRILLTNAYEKTH